jgi:hypothetical protein
VLDASGRLVAHPDISLVLRGDDDPAAARLRICRLATIGGGEVSRPAMPRAAGLSPRWRRSQARTGRPLSSSRPPRHSARSGSVLAHRSTAVRRRDLCLPAGLRPCPPDDRAHSPSEEGAERIGAGQFDHKINISTGDELEELASRFNDMADSWL